MELQQSTVLITGGTRGLGRALAAELTTRGASVVICARDSDELGATERALRERGASVFALRADVADKHAIHRLLGEANALAGPIDVLINNASTLGPVPLRLLLDTDCEELERALAVNLIGPFRLSKAVIGSMLVRRQGVVVNISSDASIEAYPSWGAYSISKVALDHLTRIWAAELADTALRVFSVDPGDMDTRMQHDAVPDGDRANLAPPERAARMIAEMIEQPARALCGARLRVSDWSAS